MLQEHYPRAEIITFSGPDDLAATLQHADACLFTAERGSAMSLIDPTLAVAIPRPNLVHVPLAYPVAAGQPEMLAYINAWIELKKRDRTIETLRDYWVLGRNAAPAEPRWSVLRDVLHWAD